MKIYNLNDVIYITIDENDLAILLDGGACQIKDRFFIIMYVSEEIIDRIRHKLGLEHEAVLVIYPDQIDMLQGYNFINYTDTLRLSMQHSFDTFADKCDLRTVNLTLDAHPTLQ